MSITINAGRLERRRLLPPLVAYVLRRVCIGFILVVAVSILVFLCTQALPGDTASAIIGRSGSEEAKARLREQLGLNEPLLSQYWTWFSGLLRGDLGTAVGSRQPVSEFLGKRMPNSLILGGLTLIVTVPTSIALGIWSGIRKDRLADHLIGGATLGFIALPEFVTGTFLISLFAIRFDVLPPISLFPPGESPLAHPDVLVLPVMTLLLAGMAYNVRMVRAGVIDTLDTEYVQMARLNGIPEQRVIRKHVLRNSMAPTVQVIALTAQWLLGGVVVVETVFQYPGLGDGLVKAVAARDIPLVQGTAMVFAVLYIGVNIVADLVIVLLIPKLRTAA